MTDQTIGQRIRSRRKAFPLTQKELGSKVGITSAAISQLEKGESKNPSSENLLRIATALECSPHWLQTGEGEADNNVAQVVSSYTVSDHIEVPFFDVELSAGAGCHIDMEAVAEHVTVGSEVLSNHNVQPDQVVAARVRGDSMSPRLLDGDTILIDTSDKRPQDGQVFAIAVESELKVKRLIRRMDGSWVISSDNKSDPSYQDETISHHNFENLRVIGKVFMIMMGGI